MKLLVVTHFYASHRGGIEIVAERLNDALLARGLSIVWAASDVTAPPSAHGTLQPLPMSAFDVTEEFFGFPYPLWSPASLAKLARAVEAADVVHLHDALYFGNNAAFALARLKKKPVVLTQHIGEVPYQSRVLRGLLKGAYATLGRTLLGNAEQVVFIAEQVRAFFASRVAFRAPPALIMNGVDARLFYPLDDPGRQGARASLGFAAGRPLFLFVGRFVEKKGLALLRRLTGALPAVQWGFAGWGPMNPSAWRHPNVRVFEHAGPDELQRLYAAADLLVLPSVGEGFPLVVQEAMACGTPALLGRDTALACPEAGNLLLHEEVRGPDELERWRRRLETLAASPEQLRALRPDVERFAVENWSWPRAAKAYEDIFERVRR